jgi:hypothetical protein
VSEPTYLDVDFHCDGEPVSVEVAVWSCGGRATTIASTSPNLLMQLVSSYVADDDLESVLVAEAFEPSDTSTPRLAQRALRVPPGVATYWRERLLEDHLDRFVSLGESEGLTQLRYTASREAERRVAAAYV